MSSFLTLWSWFLVLSSSAAFLIVLSVMVPIGLLGWWLMKRRGRK